MEKDKTFKLNSSPEMILQSILAIRDEIRVKAKEDPSCQAIAAFYEDVAKLVEIAVKMITSVKIFPVFIDPTKPKS